MLNSDTRDVIADQSEVESAATHPSCDE